MNTRSCARILPATSKESGAWLQALPLSSIGLRMDDNTVRIATGLRLGSPLCRLHTCQHCRSYVDRSSVHGLSCRWSEDRRFCHSSLNNIVRRALSSARIPSRLEPSGISGSNGKRPDGITLVPWERRKLLVWDVTCTDTFTPSFLASAASKAGAVAALAEEKKKAKYQHLDTLHMFVPFAVEITGVFGPLTRAFLKDISRRVFLVTGERLSRYHLTVCVCNHPEK